jgi:glycosyltransferase involved in cell wall biosynthesis
MNTPLVSIILPTYNGSRFIRKSIESCLAQTMSDFELIVVNDCSTDNTPSIVEGYAARDSRVRLLNNPFNKKLPLSLNTGFEAAAGKYFTWTSDDNFYAPEALQKMVEVLERDEAIDLVYCDYQLIDDNDVIRGERRFGDVNQSFTKWLGAGACFLYRRAVHAANNGYNPGAFLIEDYDFFVRAFLRFRFHYLPTTALYFYREHGASLTATQSAAINDISKIFLERNLPGLEKKLPKNEIALLYRKLAVHYGLSKNNAQKYAEYLDKLAGSSRSQVWITAAYVMAMKLAYTFSIGLRGFAQAARALFR